MPDHADPKEDGLHPDAHNPEVYTPDLDDDTWVQQAVDGASSHILVMSDPGEAAARG